MSPLSAGKKDYLLVSLIGILFGLLILPVLNNLHIGFLPINFQTALGIVIAFFAASNIGLYVASILGRWYPPLFQFAKFGAVGALNTILDFGVLNLLIFTTGIASGSGYSGFKALSFIIANVNSYFWNKYWTFTSESGASIVEFGKFFTVSAAVFLVNVLTASIIVNAIGPIGGVSPERWANAGAAAASLISLVLNFIGYKFLVFRK